MDEYQSLSHSKWEWNCHVVFIPKKCRRRTLYQQLRRQLGEVLLRFAVQKESRIEEMHLMPDHVHMRILVPSKYAVSQMIGFIKGEECDLFGAGVRRTEKVGNKTATAHWHLEKTRMSGWARKNIGEFFLNLLALPQPK